MAESVSFLKLGSKILVKDKDEALELIGKGRSAFVFKIKETNKVLKVFFPNFSHLAQVEADIYKELRGMQNYCTIYETGTNYIVIDYIEGNTLFTNLLKGIPITVKHIKDVDAALLLAKEKGLNPSDIHLRNIIVTANGTIKIIDLARFRQKKMCKRWSDLKVAYSKYYQHKFFPKRLPLFVLNMLAFLYKKQYFKRLLQTN